MTSPYSQGHLHGDHTGLQDAQQDPDLWFEDGNIILATKAVIFRVHRGVLSLNSIVFRDMFSMPQPTSGEDTVDGIPVIHLHDDPVDLKHLLKVFYDRKYYHGSSPTTFEIIAGLLRLGTKYQIDHLRAEVISHLATLYPSSLDEFVKVTMTPPDLSGTAEISIFPPFQGQHIAVLNLARETGANILLPAAFYRAACQNLGVILEGVADADESHYQLVPENMRACIFGREELMRMKRDLYWHILQCLESTDFCGVGCIHLKSNLIDYALGGSFSPHVLGCLADVIKASCPNCRPSLEECAGRMYTTIWHRLPSYFRLPNWKVLRSSM